MYGGYWSENGAFSWDSRFAGGGQLLKHCGASSSSGVWQLAVRDWAKHRLVVVRDVAEKPHGVYHFEMGRALAERLGYPAEPGCGNRRA